MNPEEANSTSELNPHRYEPGELHTRRAEPLVATKPRESFTTRTKPKWPLTSGEQNPSPTRPGETNSPCTRIPIMPNYRTTRDQNPRPLNPAMIKPSDINHGELPEMANSPSPEDPNPRRWREYQETPRCPPSASTSKPCQGGSRTPVSG